MITLFCLLLGYPVAMLMRRVGPKARLWILLLVVSPLLTSIIVRNVAVKDIEADGDNKYSVEFCGKQNYLPVHCMTYSQKGQMVMNGGYTQCEYRTKLIVTDSQKSLLSQLKKGSTWNVKGKVSTIMSVGQCGLSLRNAVLVK